MTAIGLQYQQNHARALPCFIDISGGWVLLLVASVGGVGDWGGAVTHGELYGVHELAPAEEAHHAASDREKLARLAHIAARIYI